MIRLPDHSLSSDAMAALAAWQAEVDGLPTFSERSSAAKTKFRAKNWKGNRTFVEVKKALVKMQGPTRRCVYCEDSAADEVEHIYPKSIYPDRVFVWGNYCYSCGPCNGPKSNQFSIFKAWNAEEANVAPARNYPPKKPPAGSPLLIDPRHENPMDFLWLDLEGTFLFTLHPDHCNDARIARRVEYTLELLRLNTRPFLRRARENAFTHFKALLRDYAAAPSLLERKKIKEVTLESGHQSVLVEILRQRSIYPGLNQLVLDTGDVLEWGIASGERNGTAGALPL